MRRALKVDEWCRGIEDVKLSSERGIGPCFGIEAVCTAKTAFSETALEKVSYTCLRTTGKNCCTLLYGQVLGRITLQMRLVATASYPVEKVPIVHTISITLSK